MAVVVEDSMLIRHTVCRYFEERGFVVESASNGLEARELRQQFTPNIVVTDLQMRSMTAPELITVIKSRSEAFHVPIIVLAARSTSADPAHEDRANAVIFLKGIDIIQQFALAVSQAIPEVAFE